MVSAFHSRILAFQKLGELISDSLENDFFDAVFKRQSIENKWFTEENCRFALTAIAKMLEEKSCEAFFQKYQNCFQIEQKIQKIAVISAGNIPCAAFHDFFCILVSGNQFIGKLSSQDALLLPFLSNKLVNIAPEFAEKIAFVETQCIASLQKFDKIIATGSNNSARYFEYYFENEPMLLRKNRNSIAILTGNESEDDLKKLSVDVFQYFGLGCRSVSKLYVPKNYNFKNLIKIFQAESKSLLLHNGYVNNYDYHRAIYELNYMSYYSCNSFLLVQNEAITSPIAVIYYEEYETINEVLDIIHSQKNDIQCIVSGSSDVENSTDFGNAQYPSLFDYPDKEDILLFCVA